MTTVDSQRSRVYAAEAQVRALFDSADRHGVRTFSTHGSAVELPIERRFASVTSVQAYLDAVLALNWVRQRWPRSVEPVTVRERRGRTRAHYSGAPPTVAVPTHEPLSAGGGGWALRELVVLHELAHHLVWAQHQGHGAPFVACLTELVAELVGPEAGFVLGVALHEAGAPG